MDDEHQPISITASTRISGLIRFSIPMGYYYRRILAHLRRIVCLMTCDGDVVTSGPTVVGSESFVAIRSADPLAKRTYINNLESTYPVEIREDGVTVMVVEGLSDGLMPMAGRGALTAMSYGSSPVLVVTHRRCLCGDVIESDEEPVGLDLL